MHVVLPFHLDFIWIAECLCNRIEDLETPIAENDGVKKCVDMEDTG